MNVRNIRLAAAARIARLNLESALSWANHCRSQGSTAGTHDVVVNHARAFKAASAAAHLPSSARCMEVVEQAEAWMNANGITFTR